MTNHRAEIIRIVEEYASLAGTAGFEAGVQAASQPWQNIASAPKDGTTVILATGATRCTGYWSPTRSSWMQHGTGRMLMPTLWMVLPPIPGKV